MNIGVLTGLVGIFLGSAIAYHFVSPHGTVLGVGSAVGAAFVGWFIGYAAGFLILLPFEGLARLHRFCTTGRWTDPPLENRPSKPPEADDPTA